MKKYLLLFSAAFFFLTADVLSGVSTRQKKNGIVGTGKLIVE